MAKISRKRRRAQEQSEEISPSIFEALEAHAQGIGGPEPKPKEEGVTVQDLMKEIATLKATQDELQRTNAALMTQAPATVATRPEPPKGIDMTGLPDPITESKAYADEVNKRIAANVEAQQKYRDQQAKSTADSNNRYKDLFTDFAVAFEDYADDDDKIEYAAAKAAEVAVKRGLDLDRYMFGNRDGFFRDVVKQYDRIFGPPGGAGGEDNSLEEDGDDSRTASIFGGAESGGKPSASARPGPGDMMEDLKEIQRKMGYL